MFFKQPPLQPGTIVHYPVTFETGEVLPHFIIITSCDSVCYDCLVVVTESSEFQQRKPLLMQHLVPIDKASHGFLEYDSLVNCGKFQRIRVQDIRQYLRESPAEKRGMVSAQVQNRIRDLISGSKLFSQAEKETIQQVFPK